MQLKETIVEGLKDGKAKDVVCIDMRKVNGSICDYFIIAHGDSATHQLNLFVKKKKLA